MNKIYFFIIGVLVVFVLLQNKGCVGGGVRSGSDTLVVHDTTWSVRDSLIFSKPKPAKIIHDSLFIEGKTEYLADTNYAALKVQFDDLVRKYTALAIYVDSVKLDTLGYVTVTDTIQENGIKGRSWKYNYKIPFVTKTVTITNQAPAKTQLYVGGGVNTTQTLGLHSAEAGVILKTKSDKIYGLKAGSDINGNISYGFQTYWKIGKKNK
jgi:hypothetical protein